MTERTGMTKTRMAETTVYEQQHQRIKYRCPLKAKYVLSKLIPVKSPCPMAKSCEKSRYSDPYVENHCSYLLQANKAKESALQRKALISNEKQKSLRRILETVRAAIIVN